MLAAAAAPELFAGLVLVGPSPRYIDDGDYVGGLARENIEGSLASLEGNYFRWSASAGPGELGAESGAAGNPVLVRTDVFDATQRRNTSVSF